jgi:hypothetical protein
MRNISDVIIMIIDVIPDEPDNDELIDNLNDLVIQTSYFAPEQVEAWDMLQSCLYKNIGMRTESWKGNVWRIFNGTNE